jgi:predicted nucleotidyltransferase
MKTILTAKQTTEITKIFKKYQVVFAYLFGSRATGTAIASSDYDFAVMLSSGLDFKKTFAIRCKIISEIAKILKNEKVEVAVLNDLRSILFKFVIIQEGRTLYEADHVARVMFELKIINEYYDFAPFIEKYNQAYLERELIKIAKK